jgi:hypothetical protein
MSYASDLTDEQRALLEPVVFRPIRHAWRVEVAHGRLGVLTRTVVDVGATSGSGVELSDGIHTDRGGRSCPTLMPA